MASRDEQNSAPRYDGGRADGGGAALAFVYRFLAVVLTALLPGRQADRDRQESRRR